MSPQFFRRRAIWFLLLLLPLAASAAESAELTRQREQFPLVWETAKHGPEEVWRKLAPGLETYPLYPYLELAALQHQMPQLKRAAVDKFLNAWPGQLARANVARSVFAGARQAPRLERFPRALNRRDAQPGIAVRCPAGAAGAGATAGLQAGRRAVVAVRQRTAVCLRCCRDAGPGIMASSPPRWCGNASTWRRARVMATWSRRSQTCSMARTAMRPDAWRQHCAIRRRRSIKPRTGRMAHARARR